MTISGSWEARIEGPSGHYPKLHEILRGNAEVGSLRAQFLDSGCRYRGLGMLRLQESQQDIGIDEGSHLAPVVAVD
jgi:hypothetical protein